MQWILIIYYSVTNMAYIPLFYMIISTLKNHFSPIYPKLKCRIYTVISLTLLTFLTRQLFYIRESFFPTAVFLNGIFKGIPFYFTECVIALALNYMLFKINSSQGGQGDSFAEEEHPKEVASVRTVADISFQHQRREGTLKSIEFLPLTKINDPSFGGFEGSLSFN
jgi:hypothetical protein